MSDGLELKPECITCDYMVGDEKGRACCDIGGCIDPPPIKLPSRDVDYVEVAI